MKLKILTGVLGIVAFGIFGVTGLIQFNGYRNDVNTTKSEITSLQTKYQELSEQEQTSLHNLEESGNGGFLDNVRMASMLSNITGSQFNSITALQQVEGEMMSIIKITDPADAIAFTNTVQYVQYDYTITDATQFIAALSSMNLIVYEAKIDIENNTASIIIPSASQLTGDVGIISDTQSEVVPGVDNTEVSSPVINDSTGIYDEGGYIQSEDATSEEVDYYEIEMR